jgi:subtilase family serine protease
MIKWCILLGFLGALVCQLPRVEGASSSTLQQFKARLEEHIPLLKEEPSASTVSIKHQHRIKESLKHEKRSDITKVGRSSPSTHHTVIFAIQHQNVDQLERILNDVSDPFSSNYGKFLTTDEVDALTHSPTSAQAVMTFLRLAGIKHNAEVDIVRRSRGDRFITAKAPIHVWESALQAEFHEFAVLEDPTIRFHRALQYAIPDELQAHVSAVFNTAQLPDIRRMVQRKKLLQVSLPQSDAGFHTVTYSDEELQKRATVSTAVGAGGESIVSSSATNATPSGIDGTESGLKEATAATAAPDAVTAENDKQSSSISEVFKYVTPALLNRFYNIANNDGGGLGSQAVYETIGQTYSPTDLTVFQRKFGLPVQAMAQVIGGHASNNACRAHNGNDCIEANLDVQYLMAVAQSVPTTYYYWDGDDFLLEWIQQVSEMPSPPLVFSISYGADETELPDSYGQHFDIQAMQLG